jgi:hypothetical protein
LRLPRRAHDWCGPVFAKVPEGRHFRRTFFSTLTHRSVRVEDDAQLED